MGLEWHGSVAVKAVAQHESDRCKATSLKTVNAREPREAEEHQVAVRQGHGPCHSQRKSERGTETQHQHRGSQKDSPWQEPWPSSGGTVSYAESCTLSGRCGQVLEHSRGRTRKEKCQPVGVTVVRQHSLDETVSLERSPRELWGVNYAQRH